jgi:hypothetical protein
LTTIAAITAYLTAADSGADDDNPVPLAAARNLTTDWQNLFNAIEAAGKYVSLDLTACAMANMTGYYRRI